MLEPDTARVLRSTGSWYTVAPNTTPDAPIQARIRGKMACNDKRATNPVAVGDRVAWDVRPTARLPLNKSSRVARRVSRRAAGRKAGIEQIIAANLDQAWVVQSVAMPRLNPGLVDRFLVTCARDEIPAGIALNKIDLLDDEESGASLVEIEWFIGLYTSFGLSRRPRLDALDIQGVNRCPSC